MKIHLDTVKLFCKSLLKKLETSSLKSILVSVDYYWCISFEDAYNFSTRTPKVSIGSARDDWEWLEKVLHQENPATTVDFERLGNLMQIAGEAIYQSSTIEAAGITIQIADLQQLCDFMLTKAQKSGFETIETSIDRYWSIAAEDRYNLYRDPKFTEETLEFSWEKVVKNFELLGRIIKIIGETIAKDDSNKKINWLIN